MNPDLDTSLRPPGRPARCPLEDLGMNPDLDTLVTALYVTIDDLLVAHPQWAPPRRTDRARDGLPRTRLPVLARRRLARGLHARGVRAQPRDPKRSDLAGWATYGYSASHSRYFWGLRPHLITTPSGLPITFALAGAKADERDDSSPSPPRTGTTKPPNNQAPPAPCSPTTTDPLELII